jgi:hypothetical protein
VAAVNLNCLPPPVSSFSLLLFLLFLTELVIKLESGSAFFVGGGVVLFALVPCADCVFVPKLLFALFAFKASSPCKKSSTSSSDPLVVSALSRFDEALLAMDLSIDIAELRIPDEDKRLCMDASALFGLFSMHREREREKYTYIM